MNYKKFRDIVVEEDSIEPKQMHRFLLKVALFCLFTSMSLALLTSTILSSGVAWVIMVIGGITFISILDYVAEDNIIAGNTGLYGATSGELYVNGRVGERFGVRNSGAIAVIEGAGDHCCEYMTGGRVVVLGKTGRNFAAGMSGGLAYVWDKNHDFDYFCNMDQVEINLVEEASARKELHELIRQHYLYTGSALARRMLDDWNRYIEDFIQVTPIEYKRVLEEEKMRLLQEKIANMQLINN